MALEFVPAKPEHVPELGRIFYEAFKDISDRHGFPPDASSVGFGRMVTGMMVQQEEIYGVAAIEDGQIVGSNFLLASDEVGGLGPITVEVPLQGQGIGRALMKNVIDYAQQNNIEQVRLLQDSFNMASLSLYASLGFDTKEACALMQPVAAGEEDATIRPVAEADLPAIEELSRRIYKVSRRNEVAALMHGPFLPLLRERDGRITGYFTLGIIGHGVAETEDDAVALIDEAARRVPPEMARFFCPLDEGSFYRRLLKSGCRAIKVMNLMAMGPYDSPDEVWMPSVAY